MGGLVMRYKGPISWNGFAVKISAASMVVLSVMLSGCAADSGYHHMFTAKTFSAPLRQNLEVAAGDALFMEGTLIEGEAIKVPFPIQKMIPGTMFYLPFVIRIDRGSLEMTTVTSEWKYYCAGAGKAAASYPGLGSVIREGDCVGIRISQDGKEYDWVVDNSNYNRGWRQTIWTLRMNSDEARSYAPKASPRPFKVNDLKKLTFDGHYGGQIHFTWEDIDTTGKDAKVFTFDFAGKPTLVGVKGNQFLVHQADDNKLVYEWVSLNEGEL